MHICLYSGPRKWALVRVGHIPPDHASSLCGKLVFEAVVPVNLFPADTWARLNDEIARDDFAGISEDLGIELVERCVIRFGRLMVEDPAAHPV